MHRVFVPQAIETQARVYLTEPQIHYLSHVLRLKPGDNLIAFNNTGYEYLAVIESIKKAQVWLWIESARRVCDRPDLGIKLAQAVAKSQKMDWIVQKAVELGVAEVIPILAERSQIKFNQAILDKKTAHWQAIAVSASEQCGAVFVPRVQAVMRLPEFLKNLTGKCLLLDPESVERIETHRIAEQAELCLLTGPEGGFNASEIASIKAAGVASINLGQRILRTETASLAALSIIQYFRKVL